MDPIAKLNRLDALALEPRWPISDSHLVELSKYFPQRELNSIRGLRDMLNDITDEIRISSAVEVGCYRGVSTECLAMFCGTLFAIDPWEDSDPSIKAAFDARIADYANVVPLRNSSPAVCSNFSLAQFDLVYIDGMHTHDEVIADIEAWLPLVRPGGFLCGHDFADYQDSWASQWIQVQPAVRKTLGEPHKVYADSSWLWRKPE